MLALVIILALAVVLIVYAVGIYNGLVGLKENVRKAWANIDVLLSQRHDELPKLVETCKQYMKYEQDTLEKVMRARTAVAQAQTRGDLGKLGAAETQLRAGLGQLYAVAENYPELKANQNFLHLQNRISQLENALADRREFYNEAVNLNNIRVQVFPDVLVARRFAFPTAQLLEFTQEQKRDVDLKGLFGS